MNLRVSLYALVLLLVFPCEMCRADISTGLVGWWKFKEGTGSSAADSSGHSDTGTLENSPTWVTGKIWPNALSLNGSNQYVLLASVPSGIVQDYTVSAWVNSSTNSNFSNLAQIVSATGGGGEGEFQLALTNSPSNAIYSFTNGPQAISNAVVLTPGTWHLVLFTRASTGTIIFYLDGANAGSASGGSNTASGTTTFGAYSTGTSNFFQGDIEDIRFYSRVLSPSDVLQLYYYRPPTNQFSHAHLAHFKTTLQ